MRPFTCPDKHLNKVFSRVMLSALEKANGMAAEEHHEDEDWKQRITA
jgi:hypothetical protein